MSAELQERARELWVPGIFTQAMVARELGVARKTVQRWLNPGLAERDRQASRAAKHRRTGTCEKCGAPTSYNGHTGDRSAVVDGISRYCSLCANRMAKAAVRGTGPTQAVTLALLAERPHRFMEIARAHNKPKGAIGPHLLRLMEYGLVVRPKRGLYALGNKERAA